MRKLCILGSKKARELVSSLKAIEALCQRQEDDGDSLLEQTEEILKRDDLEINCQCSELLLRIIEYLLKYFSENKLLTAFKRVRIRVLEVSAIATLQCIKYFSAANWVHLTKMKVSVSAVRRQFDLLGCQKFKKVEIRNCDLEDDQITREIGNSNLTQLMIQDCRVKNAKSLINAFHWGTSSSCNYFGLRTIKLESGGWKQFVDAIEVEKKVMRCFDVKDCTPCISEDLQIRV